jgi:hypothetical protein
MPGPFRMTAFFRDHAYGWSETHWGGPGITTLAEMQPPALQYVQARAALLGSRPGDSDPQINYIRLSDDSVRGDSIIMTPQAGGGAIGGKIGLDDPPEVPYSVLLLRGTSGANYHKNFFLSGVPQSAIVDPPGPILTPDFSAAFKKFATVLVAFFGWVGKTKGAPGQVKNITGIGGANENLITCPAHGFLTGQSVLIRNCVPKYPITGYHSITVVDADHFTLNGVVLTGYVYLNGGTATLNLSGVIQYLSVIIRGETHRNRGRPFPFVRGRRRVKH